ncbi:DUF5658 family protein [Sulfurisphaera tokodaii]|uniref:Uncharacterized protein n=2 Tax=Sulfurisphaera tokodaii TaxID=111955 RepID=Q96XU6_SULTO|nr:DUF5658 family protein [Sulfurisphaera tokodaii]BAB67531.1 hypothetical protein STK_24205 [Sulfurisphaera tokodaii str. 7]HII74068.1 hypothetical protein [Sulfurisphaera tokodaii]
MRIEKPLLMSLLTFFSSLDILTTYVGISKGLTEDNVFLSSFGSEMFIVMTILKISVIALSYILLKKGYVLPVIIVMAMMAFAVINNFTLLF